MVFRCGRYHFAVVISNDRHIEPRDAHLLPVSQIEALHVRLDAILRDPAQQVRL